MKTQTLVYIVAFALINFLLSFILSFWTKANLVFHVTTLTVFILLSVLYISTGKQEKKAAKKVRELRDKGKAIKLTNPDSPYAIDAYLYHDLIHVDNHDETFTVHLPVGKFTLKENKSQ